METPQTAEDFAVPYLPKDKGIISKTDKNDKYYRDLVEQHDDSFLLSIDDIEIKLEISEDFSVYQFFEDWRKAIEENKNGDN